MTTFYIFRHGDTIDSGSLLAKVLGHRKDSHNLDILPKGIPALKKIGAFLKNVGTDADFSSPYIRCRKSSQIVGNIAKKKYKIDKRLRELENNGEQFSDFYNRVRSFLNEIQEKNYSAVSICTHGAVIAAIKHLETRGKFFFFQVWDFPAPGNVIIIKNGKVSLVNFN